MPHRKTEYVAELDTARLAERLGVSEQTIWRWAREDKLPRPLDKPGRMRWSEADIEDWERSGNKVRRVAELRAEQAGQPSIDPAAKAQADIMALFDLAKHSTTRVLITKSWVDGGGGWSVKVGEIKTLPALWAQTLVEVYRIAKYAPPDLTDEDKLNEGT